MTSWLDRYMEYEAKATPGPWLERDIPFLTFEDEALYCALRNSAPALAALVEEVKLCIAGSTTSDGLEIGPARGDWDRMKAALTALDRDAAGGT